MHDVAILYYIFLAFSRKLSCSPGGTLASEGDIVLVFDDFRPYEAFFKIRVDDSCGLGRLVSLVDRPGTAFVGAGGEECLKS